MSVTKKFKIDPKISAKIHEQLRALDETHTPTVTEEQEIDQIMSEIESLQKRVSEPANLRIVPTQSNGDDHEPTSDSIMDEFRSGSSDEPSMEETLSDLRDEGPSGPSLLDDPVEMEMKEDMGPEDPEEFDGKEVDTRDSEVEDEFEDETPEMEMEQEDEFSKETNFNEGETMSEGDGTMTMVLNGNMTLKLKYEVDGQEVTIGFADKMLKVQLADGTEFKIPIRATRMIKKAA